MPDGTLQKIGTGLAAFGAGVQGQGPQFLAGMQQQRQQLDDQRKAAMIEDAFRVKRSLESGDTAGAVNILSRRVGAIQQLGGDPSDTLGVLKKLESGDLRGALIDVNTVVGFAQAQGLLQAAPGPPELKTQIVGGQVVATDPRTGRAVATDIEGLADSADGLEKEKLELRRRELSLKEQTEARQTAKLSAGLEKALLQAQDRTVQAQRDANEFDVLASDFERIDPNAGIKSTVTETLKNILGTQDAVSEFRRKFNQVRISRALNNLPPGVASDKDVELAFKGVPKESASPEQVASFLRGAAKLARFEAGFNQFKSDFISTRSTGKGLNQLWRKKLTGGPALKGREVSVAEIYGTAQNRDITPEEVIKQLGIEGSIF